MTVSKTLLLFALVAASGLSGCFGSGDDQAAMATYTAYDPATGQVLVDPATGRPVADVPVRFHPGSGDSGFGADFERRVLKAGIAEQINVTARATFHDTVARDRVFGPFPAINEASFRDFVQAFGEPTVGQVFDATALFPARVEAIKEPVTEVVQVPFRDPVTNETSQRDETRVVEAGIVTYRLTPENGQRDPVGVVGAVLVTYVEGDSITQILEPQVGAMFMVSPPRQGQGTPLDLAPGMYRTAGANSTHILYDFSQHTVEALFNQNVWIHAKLVSVSRAPATAPEGDNFGARKSPQLNPMTAPMPGAQGAAQEPAHDDHGHEDDGHTH